MMREKDLFLKEHIDCHFHLKWGKVIYSIVHQRAMHILIGFKLFQCFVSRVKSLSLLTQL